MIQRNFVQPVNLSNIENITSQRGYIRIPFTNVVMGLIPNVSFGLIISMKLAMKTIVIF